MSARTVIQNAERGSLAEIKQLTRSLMCPCFLPHQSRHTQLAYEYRLYRILQNKNGTVPGIPAVKWFGREGDFNVLVMELLGPSLEDMFNCQTHTCICTLRCKHVLSYGC